VETVDEFKAKRDAQGHAQQDERHDRRGRSHRHEIVDQRRSGIDRAQRENAEDAERRRALRLTGLARTMQRVIVMFVRSV
jgi:hypothetical protein